MATTYKILGQSAPATANTEYDLYTVNSSYSIVSSITVCNRSGLTSTFSIAINQSGDVTADYNYLYYTVSIPGYDTFIATVGLTLSQGDVIKVKSSNDKLSFQAFGSEIS